MQRSKPPTIFFSVGEPSGDLHGANLIRRLQILCPGIQAVGYGGPKMAEAGCQLHADLTALAVMWFARALVNLHKFWDLASRADRYFRHHRPDAVVLIDYPGFNWWIARRAKVHGIPVFYYSPPQIWAWARWRVKKMRRLVDHVLCGLPFEESWFRGHGCNATFVGHPFFDEVRRYPYDEAFIAERRRQPGPLVVILPGSRTQEVTHNLHWFLKAADIIRRQVPDVRFAVASFKPHQAEIARRMVEAAAKGGQSHFCGAEVGLSGGTTSAAKIGTVPSRLPIEICVGKTPELMRLADAAMSVSGSVSLELLYHATPTVILYWVSRFAFFVQRFVRKVKYITLVNLLASGGVEEGSGFRVQGLGVGGQGAGEAIVARGESSGFRVQGSGEATVDAAEASNPSSFILHPSSSIHHPPSTIHHPSPLAPFLDASQVDAEHALFPEYLTCGDKSAEIAGHIIQWLNDPEKRTARVEALAALRGLVAHGGASHRAAESILDKLGQRRQPAPRPHFVVRDQGEREEGREESGERRGESEKRSGIAFQG